MWNGENESGQKVSAGIYCYGMVTDNLVTINKMIPLE